MVKNYIKVALRQLKRHKAFSIINILGLSTSLAIGLVIIMMVSDQLLYDSHNPNKDRIYRVNTEVLRKNESSSLNKYATTTLPVATELKENYSGIAKVARIRRGFGNGWIEFDKDLNVPLGGFFADPELIDILDLKFEFGNPKTALSKPYSVVLTRKAADKLFKDPDPVGQTIKVGELGEYTVTGVLKSTKNKSHIVYEALASISTVPLLEKEEKMREYVDSWKSFTAGWVYIMLNKGKNPEEVNAYLGEISKKFISESGEIHCHYYLQSLNHINPGPLLANMIGPGMPLFMVYFLGGLALVIILTACFNYTNLSIARALNRAKEVGIRKVSGAKRKQIIGQFLGESILISLLALIISYLLLAFLKPAFQNLSFSRMLQWDLAINLQAVIISITVAVSVGVIAGILPALVLSSFHPIRVLKDLSGMKLLSRIGLRKVLLIVQFSLSLIFIVTVILIHNQMNFMIHSDYGFDTKNNLRVALGETNWKTFKTELLSHSDVLNVTAASHIPGAGTTYGNTFFRDLKDPKGLDYFSVDQDYIENMGLKLIAGKNFPDQIPNQEEYVILNEKAVQDLGYETPLDAIGQTIYNQDTLAVQIIGVVKNYHHSMMVQEIHPMALRYLPDNFNLLQVKLANKNDISTVEDAWEKINPGKLMDSKFMGDEIAEFYNILFGDLVKIISLISFLAISISCLGLLGMATYTIETRMKEISIRKVLGASNISSIYLLSKGFMILLGVAIIISVPLAIVINNLWLQFIAFRVPIGFTVILSGILIVLVLGLTTISTQALRALKVNPADTLRNE